MIETNTVDILGMFKIGHMDLACCMYLLSK